MRTTRRVLTVLLLAADDGAQALQYPPPTVTVQCTVNRSFVERYAIDQSSRIRDRRPATPR